LNEVDNAVRPLLALCKLSCFVRCDAERRNKIFLAVLIGRFYGVCFPPQSLFPGSDRWVVVHRDESTGSEVWSRKDDKDAARPDLLCVNATIEGVDAATAFELFYKMNERAAWDTYTQARARRTCLRCKLGWRNVCMADLSACLLD
jgi:hypothetical protein